MTAPALRRSGVCVVRFEPPPNRWLVTVTTTWPLTGEGRATGPTRVEHFTDLEAALALVVRTVRKAFVSGGGDSGAPVSDDVDVRIAGDEPRSG